MTKLTKVEIQDCPVQRTGKTTKKIKRIAKPEIHTMIKRENTW